MAATICDTSAEGRGEWASLVKLCLVDFLHAGMPGHLPQHATIAAAYYQHLPGRILQHLTALQSLQEHKEAVCT